MELDLALRDAAADSFRRKDGVGGGRRWSGAKMDRGMKAKRRARRKGRPTLIILRDCLKREGLSKGRPNFKRQCLSIFTV